MATNTFACGQKVTVKDLDPKEVYTIEYYDIFNNDYRLVNDKSGIVYRKQDSLELYTNISLEYLKTKQDVCIQCDSEEQANKVCIIFHKAGLKWANGDSYLLSTNFRHLPTCYYPYNGMISNLVYAKEKNCEIVKAKDFISANQSNTNQAETLIVDRKFVLEAYDAAPEDIKIMIDSYKLNILKLDVYVPVELIEKCYEKACPEWKIKLEDKFSSIFPKKITIAQKVFDSLSRDGQIYENCYAKIEPKDMYTGEIRVPVPTGNNDKWTKNAFQWMLKFVEEYNYLTKGYNSYVDFTKYYKPGAMIITYTKNREYSNKLFQKQ